MSKHSEKQGQVLEEIFQEAIETFRERGKVYGNAGFREHGEVLKALFPNGLLLTTEEDFSRFVLVNMILTKICRYSKNMMNGGHQDSIHDLGVYSFILEAFDRTARE